MIGAVELKGVLGNINAQNTNSHIDLPSKVKVQQTESSPEDPAGLAAWMGMVHYISTKNIRTGPFWTNQETAIPAQSKGAAASLDQSHHLEQHSSVSRHQT